MPLGSGDSALSSLLVSQAPWQAMEEYLRWPLRWPWSLGSASVKNRGEAALGCHVTTSQAEVSDTQLCKLEMYRSVCSLPRVFTHSKSTALLPYTRDN